MGVTRQTATPTVRRRWLFQGIRPVSRAGTLRDALAGCTLAAMNVPQALGYTRIAGTPVVTGLYTLLLPLVAFATFGSSRYLVVAADSATAAILAGGLSHLAPVASWSFPWPGSPCTSSNFQGTPHRSVYTASRTSHDT